MAVMRRPARRSGWRQAHGAEAVGDDDDGAVLHQVGQRRLNQGLALGVECGNGCVEDEDGGVFEDGAGDGQALALAAGETRAFLADDGVIALGHAQDEVVSQGGARGLLHQVKLGFGLAVGDIVANVSLNRMVSWETWAT